MTVSYTHLKSLGKQFQYADKRGIPLVAILGADEIDQGVVKLKRLKDGEEITVERSQTAGRIQEWLA